MIENLPNYISNTFIISTLLTLAFFYLILKNSRSIQIRQNSIWIIIGLIVWLIFQAIVTINNIYNSNTNIFPPKIVLFGVLPTFILIASLFLSKKGKIFIDSLPLKNITFLNIVRIPVEMVLYWLFLANAVPELMTFEGRNFDILAGITAPIMTYFVFKKPVLGSKVLLIWNFICLALLLNIVVNALLSAPSPFQKFAFEQPNIAILYFPISWLPTFIVPIVLFGHLVSIRQLLNEKGENK